jgi:hypothetical protein
VSVEHSIYTLSPTKEIFRQKQKQMASRHHHSLVEQNLQNGKPRYNQMNPSTPITCGGDFVSPSPVSPHEFIRRATSAIQTAQPPEEEGSPGRLSLCMNGSRPSSIVTSTSLCAEEAYWAKKNTCGIEPPPYSHPKALSRDGKTITAEEGGRKLSNTSLTASSVVTFFVRM